MTHQPTEPRPPDAWLAACRLEENTRVLGVFSSPDDPKLVQMITETSINKIDGGSYELFAIKDDPGINVSHSGLEIYGPEHLAARDNWFFRYSSVLESHLKNPIRAQAFTFAPGKLTDPLVSHKSTKRGPFPWPKGRSMPKCDCCKNVLVFLGVLDFRQFSAVRVPKGSLVFHGCDSCGIEAGSYSLTWITDVSSLEIHGSESEKSVLVGTSWNVTDYPPIGISPDEVTDRGAFLWEHSFFTIITCFANKVGGHIFWIQPHDDTPLDSQGQPMKFVGQFLGSPDVEFGDAGIAYIFYSEETGESKMACQYF